MLAVFGICSFLGSEENLAGGGGESSFVIPAVPWLRTVVWTNLISKTTVCFQPGMLLSLNSFNRQLNVPFRNLNS